MDWSLAIEINRAALKRIVAMLVAMAGLLPSTGAGPAACGSSRPLDAFRHATGMTDFGQGPKPASLPRHLHRAVLRLLRPAESAARRLVIAAAREIVLPQVCPRGAAPVYKTVRNCTGISTPPENDAISRQGFQFLDPLPRWRPHRPVRTSVPRISFPGFTQLSPIAPPPAPDDPIDATRLALRLQALERALDDLPGHARRFSHWRARQAFRAGASGQNRRFATQDVQHTASIGASVRNGKLAGSGASIIERRAGVVRRWPLRMGRPPGWRRKGSHEIQDILTNTNGLALYALEGPDTS